MISNHHSLDVLTSKGHWSSTARPLILASNKSRIEISKNHADMLKRISAINDEEKRIKKSEATGKGENNQRASNILIQLRKERDYVFRLLNSDPCITDRVLSAENVTKNDCQIPGNPNGGFGLNNHRLGQIQRTVDGNSSCQVSNLMSSKLDNQESPKKELGNDQFRSLQGYENRYIEGQIMITNNSHHDNNGKENQSKTELDDHALSKKPHNSLDSRTFSKLVGFETAKETLINNSDDKYVNKIEVSPSRMLRTFAFKTRLHNEDTLAKGLAGNVPLSASLTILPDKNSNTSLTRIVPDLRLHSRPQSLVATKVRFSRAARPIVLSHVHNQTAISVSHLRSASLERPQYCQSKVVSVQYIRDLTDMSLLNTQPFRMSRVSSSLRKSMVELPLSKQSCFQDTNSLFIHNASVKIMSPQISSMIPPNNNSAVIKVENQNALQKEVSGNQNKGTDPDSNLQVKSSKIDLSSLKANPVVRRTVTTSRMIDLPRNDICFESQICNTSEVHASRPLQIFNSSGLKSGHISYTKSSLPSNPLVRNRHELISQSFVIVSSDRKICKNEQSAFSKKSDIHPQHNADSQSKIHHFSTRLVRKVLGSSSSFIKSYSSVSKTPLYVYTSNSKYQGSRNSILKEKQNAGRFACAITDFSQLAGEGNTHRTIKDHNPQNSSTGVLNDIPETESVILGAESKPEPKCSFTNDEIAEVRSEQDIDSPERINHETEKTGHRSGEFLESLIIKNERFDTNCI
jgi:hypothetical protein